MTVIVYFDNAPNIIKHLEYAEDTYCELVKIK